MNSDNQRDKKQGSLRFSFLDGVFASIMTGLTQDYFTPFVLLLGASVRHVGFLSALPNLMASLVQLKSADVAERLRSRLHLITFFVLLQASMLVPMVFLASRRSPSVGGFILCAVLFASLGAFSTPAWGSLMADLVEEKKRGDYFGWRNRALGFISVATAFVAGAILQAMKTIDIYTGFVIIFSCAAISRLISWYFLSRMYEPPLHIEKEHYFSFFDFLRRIRQSNFARFVLFVATLNFSVNLASPFFSVLMLRDLHFSYFLYIAITATATATIFVTIRRWGRHADRVGNLKVLRLTAPIIGCIPLLWVLNRHPAYLFFAQIVSGFAWAGFNLCASNYIYDAVTPEKRTRCISYFNVINGLALGLGAILGGFLIPYLPSLFGFKILSIFVISSLLRVMVGLLVPFRLREVRPVDTVRSAQLFFSVVGIRPLLGIERKTVRT